MEWLKQRVVLNSEISFKDRVEGMLMASAIADAMAGPHEGRQTYQSQKFLEQGGWINNFEPYSEWFQSHWNVYTKTAPAGTYTDDTRLRLLVAKAMLEYEKANPKKRMTKEFLATQIFTCYQKANDEFHHLWGTHDSSFTDTEQEVLEQRSKEAFLHVWFLWELAKTATSVYVPLDPPITSPGVERIDKLNTRGERTRNWYLSKAKKREVICNIKDSFHKNSYKKGEELPLGLIALLPLSVYFPGKPAQAFHYFLEIDFLDIKNANLYAATTGAILADLLGGESWDEIATKISTMGLGGYVHCNHNKDLGRVQEGFISALSINKEFKNLPSYLTRENYIHFIKALQKCFGVGEEMMCTPHEMFSVPIAIVDYTPNNLKLLIEMGVNYGRDNDTVASIAACLGGAMMGIDTLPLKWQETVKEANTEIDIYSIAKSLSNLCGDYIQ